MKQKERTNEVMKATPKQTNLRKKERNQARKK